MIITAGKIEQMVNTNSLAILMETSFKRKENAKGIKDFYDTVMSKFEPLTEERSKFYNELIQKYGTEEEIKNNQLEKTSPNYEDALKEYTAFVEEWNKKEIEVSTFITKETFKDVIWKGSLVGDLEKVIELVFGE